MSSSKLLSLFISFCLLFEQSLFAQAIDLSRYFVRNSGQNIPQSDKFRPLHLRYLGYDNLSQDFKILLDKGDAKKEDLENKAYIEENTQILLKYFFIGLSLPNEKFWVNLRPDSPDNILDPDLEKTDIGRIFLEADLQLKKDTASFTSPQNPQGKAYWDKLYKKAGELFPAVGGSAFGGGNENITIPTITRPWIVPGEIIIREAPDNAYIYKATLKVMLEEDYLKSSQLSAGQKAAVGLSIAQAAVSSQQYVFNDPRLKELNQYSTQLIKETIIPKLTYEVNTSKRYAPLRQVYYSLILAQWFKQKYGSMRSTGAPVTRAPVNNYISMIDSGNLTNLTSSQSYDKQAYFKQYQKSFKDGEYNLQEPVYTPMGQSIRRYTSGGVIVDIASSNMTVIKANKGDIPFSSSPMNLYVSPGNQDKLNLTVPMMSFPGRLSPTDELIYSLLQEKRKISQEKLRIVDLGVGYLPYTTLELANKVKDLGAEVLGIDRVYPYKVIRKPGHYVVVFEESEDKKPRFVNAYSENAAFVPPGKDEAEAMLARIDREKETGINEKFYVRPFEDFQKKAPNLRFKKGDFDNDLGGLHLESVDVIRVCNVLSYYRDSYKEIIEDRLAPLLKPDGILIVGEQDIESGELKVELWRKRQGSIVLEEKMNLVGIGRRLVGPKADPEQILVGKKIGDLGTNLEEWIREDLGLTDMGEVRWIDESELKKFREIIVNRLNRLDIHAEIRPGGFISVKRASSALNEEKRQFSVSSAAEGQDKKRLWLRFRDYMSNYEERETYLFAMQNFYKEIADQMQKWDKLKSPKEDARSYFKQTPIYLAVIDAKWSSFFRRMDTFENISKSKHFEDIVKERLVKFRQTRTSQAINIAVIGAAYGQEMISAAIYFSKRIKNMLSKERDASVLEKNIVINIHVIDKSDIVYDKLKNNEIVYPAAELMYYFEKEEIDLYFAKKANSGNYIRSPELDKRLKFYDVELTNPILSATHRMLGDMDVVMVHSVLQHVRSKRKNIPQYLHALLKPGGILSIITQRFYGNPAIEKMLKSNKYLVLMNRKFFNRVDGIYVKQPGVSSIDNYKKDSLTSSPSTSNDKGGIAFNALPIQTESVASSALGALVGGRAFKGDLDAEWVQIQAMFNAGIRPSIQRLADFTAAGVASPLASQRREDVLGLVAELLRRDEEDVRLAPIDPTLKGLLNALESLS